MKKKPKRALQFEAIMNLPVTIEQAVEEAVSAAIEKLDIDVAIQDAIKMMDIDKIIDDVFREFGIVGILER